LKKKQATKEQLQMNETVKIFNDRPLRILHRDGEPWFVGKDVCDILEICEAHRSLKSLDQDERHSMTVTDVIGRQQEMTIISESGLYSLILRSRKAEAKAFKRWITHDVLPSIRKTGAYLSVAITDRQIEALITTLEQEVCRRASAEQQVEFLRGQLEKLTLAVMPKCVFGEISRTTGLPKDKVIFTHLRSDRRRHQPQSEKYIQLLLPLYASRELLKQALLPVLADGSTTMMEECNA
jgi:prophage antirepressor-like protein